MNLYAFPKSLLRKIWWAILLTLTACAGVTTSQPSAVTPSVSFNPSSDLTSTPTLFASVSPPTITSSPIPHNNYKIKQIDAKSAEGVIWSLDGQLVQYARRIGSTDSRESFQWFTYDLKSGQSSSSNSPLAPDEKVLKKLNGVLPIGNEWWFEGRVSPSGQKIIYLEALSMPPASKVLSYSASLWVASFEGLYPNKLGKCFSFGRVTWFDQESKVLVPCYGESGGPTYYIGEIARGIFISIRDITTFNDFTVVGTYALSPDGKLLAFPDSTFTLQLIPLNKTPIQLVAHGGYPLEWSKDGKSLYYLKTDPSDNMTCTSVHIYELSTKVDRVVLEFPISLPNNQVLESILCEDAFSVSSLRNAAVFSHKGLWLIEWQ